MTALLVVTLGPQEIGAQVGTEAPEATSSASAGRVLGYAGVGLLGGAALGVAYGAVDHPGLPHKTGDVPPALEYVVEFAVIGALVGAILGTRSVGQDAGLEVRPYAVPHVPPYAAGRKGVAWGWGARWRY